MGLTVNRQIVQKITVNRQKWIILTVNRQLNQALLAVKRLKYLLLRTVIVPNNDGKSTITLVFPNKIMYENFSFVSVSF